MSNPVSAYARLNARLRPLDRGDRYEDPLQEALQKNGWAAVSGGGTMQGENGEIVYCGVDIDLFDVDKAVPFICECLARHGAPRGSILQYQANGEACEVPFGFLQGLAVYLNGTDLPAEVYRNCDVNHVYGEINRLLGSRGGIQSHWQGRSETALYLYGYAVDEMQGLIQPLMSTYPLCARARYATVA
jgi:hypothetical protein